MSLDVKDKWIRFPVREDDARWLCQQARPVKHGYKAETRLDPKVRDTWEIPASEITGEGWLDAIEDRLEQIRSGLGVPRGCHLRAQLHNLLIYGPGQFFAPHPDSEKTSGMIGTLIVLLPCRGASRGSGGELVIEHQGERKVFQETSVSALTLIAFYADCRHEVQPVKHGYRLALTFNLSVEGEPVCGGPVENIDRLTAAVRQYFDPSSPRYRLVYLLDHQYTRAGLDRNRLKGSDAVSFATLCEAARRLDCEIFLALADVSESWAGKDTLDLYGSRAPDDVPEDWEAERLRRFALEEDAYPVERSSQHVFELISKQIELRHALGADERSPGLVSKLVSDDELCFAVMSSELRPFKSKSITFIGNDGAGVQRWYHRAAIVLWPRQQAFELQAKHSPSWALGELARTRASSSKGGRSAALALARRLPPLWEAAIQLEFHQESPQLLSQAVAVAAALGEPALAAVLLSPFTLDALGRCPAPTFASLLDAYGESWCRSLLDAMPGIGCWPYPSPARALPGLCEALAALPHGIGEARARALLAQFWTAELARLSHIEGKPGFQQPDEADLRAEAFLNLLNGADTVGDATLKEQILARLQAPDPFTRMIAERLPKNLEGK